MNKNTYLIALDMDGTLLNNKKKISLLTKLYLRKLSKQGHKIVLASGRPSRALTSYYDELKSTAPIICYNGAYCYSPNDKNFPTVEFQFPKETIVELINKLRPLMNNMMCETDTEIWVDKNDGYLAKFFWYEKMDIHYGDLTTILNKNPMTFIAQTDAIGEDREKIINIVKQYKDIEVRFWTGSPYFEFYFKGTSKGARVQEIANYYGIPKERIIVFGDAINDLEMMDVAGHPIAMKNAKDELKKATKFVSIKDNNHNGIYYTLKKYFKL